MAARPDQVQQLASSSTSSFGDSATQLIINNPNILRTCIVNRFLEQFQEYAALIATHEEQEIRLTYGRQLKEALQKADELNVVSLINGVLSEIEGQLRCPGTLQRTYGTSTMIFPPICTDVEVLAIAKRRGGQAAKSVIHAAFDYELTQNYTPKSSNPSMGSIELVFSEAERAAASRVFLAKTQNSPATPEDGTVVNHNKYLKALVNKYVAMCQPTLRTALASAPSSSNFSFATIFASIGELFTNGSVDKGDWDTPSP